MFEDLTKSLKNEASVIGESLANAPAAIWDELRKDFSAPERGNLIQRELAYGGAGLGIGVLLHRTPGFARFGLGALAAVQGLRIIGAVGSVAGRAWDADEDWQRKALVDEATRKLGTEGASIVESTPAMIFGGVAGGALSRRVAVLDAAAFRTADKISFIGPGTEKMPKGLMKPDGRLDIVALSQQLAERHPWKGVEVGRSVRLSDMKASRPTVGTETGLVTASHDRAGRVFFHTHPPELGSTTKVLGARPSYGDVVSTKELGVINSGTVTTVYEGLAAEAAAANAAGKPFNATLRAVVFDHQSKLAIELQNGWNPISQSWAPNPPRFIDYGETVKTLSNWDRSWSSISAIAPDSQALLNPAFRSFLKLGTYESMMPGAATSGSSMIGWAARDTVR